MMPRRPMMMPPVGKSGPGTISIRRSTPISGSSIVATIAPQISRTLWGGIVLDMPTAMPLEPFTSRLGNLPGRTHGSMRRSS